MTDDEVLLIIEELIDVFAEVGIGPKVYNEFLHSVHFCLFYDYISLIFENR